MQHLYKYNIFLLCSRPIGRITRVAHPSVPHGLVTRKQKRRKIKIGVDVLHGTSKCSANFQFQMSRSQDVKPQNLA